MLSILLLQEAMAPGLFVVGAFYLVVLLVLPTGMVLVMMALNKRFKRKTGKPLQWQNYAVHLILGLICAVMFVIVITAIGDLLLNIAFDNRY